MNDVAIIGVGLHPFGRFGAKSAINEFASFRAQVSFDYGFEGDLKATRTLGLQLGLSLFVE